MEAPEQSNNRVVCPACQAWNDATAKVCAVCGSSLDPAANVATESSIEQELGRANLMRMRGQSKDAIDACLAILRKAPNNVTAHSMLGDIYYDLDDLRQAAEWYELASHLDPSATREKQLLERIRERVKQKDQLQTLQQLGVETKTPPLNRYLFGAIMVLLVLGTVGVVAITVMNQNRSKPSAIQNPIVVPPSTTPTDNNPTTPIKTEVPTAPPQTLVAADEEALTAIKQGPNASLIIGCQVLPDASRLVVTARPADGQSDLVTALLVASDVFVHRASTRSATIRLVKDGVIVFSGQITRDGYTEAQGLSSQTSPDLESIARQAFPDAWPNGDPANVKPRSDQGEAQSSGSGLDQRSGSPPSSP